MRGDLLNQRGRFLRTLALVLVTALLGGLLAGCDPGVPDVTGKTPADAVRVLQDAGYKLGNVSYGFKDGAELGVIISQSPAAGERAKDGAKIDLQVNGNDGTTAIVPNVIQQTQTTAVQAVKTSALTPVVSYQYSDTVAKDIVITQSPTGGYKAGIGAPVIVVVSQGKAPAKAPVPGVTGKKQTDAESAIKSAGFTPKVYTGYSSKFAKGLVILQIPESGTQASPGSTVEIVVSLGAGTGAIKVPNVIGKKEADAVNAIKSAGLVAKVFRSNSETAPAGTVMLQSPEPGTTTGRGSQVALVISLGKAASGTVAVPNVMGKSQADAEAALSAAGFTVALESVPSSTVAPGTVGYQFPAGGDSAPKGTSVLIAISAAP